MAGRTVAEGSRPGLRGPGGAGAYWRYGFHEDGVQSALACLGNWKHEVNA